MKARHPSTASMKIVVITTALLSILLTLFSPIATTYAVDKGQETCNQLHPHDPSKTDSEETKNFRACLRGYREGEGGCDAEYPVNNTARAEEREKCMEGHEKSREVEGAQSPPNDPGIDPAKIGPRPTTLDPEDLIAPQSTRQIRQPCSLDGFIGNLMCGGINIVGNMADASLLMLGAFMKTPPLMTGPPGTSPTYDYWKVFRDLSNAFFIIAFFVTIYSYVTGFGLSMYSVKKMVPRIVAAALLVNLSFYICSVAVDISNILGGTIYGTLHDLIAPAVTGTAPSQTTDPLQTAATAAASPSDEISSWTTAIAVGTTAVASSVAVVAWGGFASLIPIVLSVLLAITVTVLSLLLRQALIIVFIIISPLAFVSILLPHTKQLYDRWSKAFLPMLMLYPVIALMFGLGHIAANIIGAAVSTSSMPEQLIFIVMAMGVQIVPLLLVPKMMQLGGGLMAQFSGAASQRTTKINQKAQDNAAKRRKLNDIAAMEKPTKFNKLQRMRGERRLKNQAIEGAWEAQQDKLYPNATPKPIPTTDDASTDKKEAENKDDADQEQKPQLIGEYDLDDPNKEPDRNTEEAEDEAKDYQPDDKTDESESSRAIHIKAKARTRAVEARAVGFIQDGTTRDEMINIVTGKSGESELDREAAALSIASGGDVGGIIEYLKTSGESSRAVRQRAVSGMRSSRMGTNATFASNPTAAENILQGTVNSNNFAEKVMVPSINQDDYSPASLATQDATASQELLNALEDSSLRDKIDKQKANDILQAAAEALNNEKTNSMVAKNRGTLEKMREWHNNGGFQ